MKHHILNSDYLIMALDDSSGSTQTSMYFSESVLQSKQGRLQHKDFSGSNLKSEFILPSEKDSLSSLLFCSDRGMQFKVDLSCSNYILLSEGRAGHFVP